MSSLYRRHGIYWRQYRTNGRTFRESLHTRDRSTAIYIKAQKDRELLEGQNILPDQHALCLPVLEKYRRDFRHARTAKHNSDQDKRIKDFLAWAGARSFNQITTPKIKEYLNHCIEKKLGLFTVNAVLQNLKTWLRYCHKERYITDNPAAGIPKYRVPQRAVRCLSPDEIKAILDAAQNTRLYVDRKPTLYPVIATGLYTGLRQRELFTLAWSDIDWSQNIIRVVNKAGFTTKNKKNRAIPLHAVLKDILRPLKKKDGPCFDTTNQRRIFSRIRKAAHLNGIGWHTLRHTFASQALMSGIPIATVSKWLGHSAITTTMIYAHLLRDHQQDEIKKLNF